MFSALFLRLYLSVVGVVVLSAGITFFAIDYYIQKDQISDFVDDINEVVSFVQGAQAVSLNLSTVLHQVRKYSGFDVELLNDSELDDKTSKLVYINTIGEVRVYELEENIFSAVAPLNENSYLLISDPIEWIQEAREQDDLIDEEESQIEISGAIIGALLVFLSIATVLYFPIFAIVRHIQSLSLISRRFSTGDYSARADINMPSPLNELAHSFNTMVETIQQSMDEQKIMSNAVAHELRTPLSRFRLALGLLESYDMPEQAKKLVHDLDGYTTELQKLTDEILTLATLQSNQSMTNKESIALGRFIRDRASEFQAFNDEVTIEVVNNIEGCLHGEPRYLQLALDNLIKNACKFAKSRVTIDTSKADGAITITVSDDGPGIAEKDRPKVLMPFARLDESRTRDTGGFGLGLAIVNVVMTRFNGAVLIEESPWGGSAFKLKFPLNKRI